MFLRSKTNFIDLIYKIVGIKTTSGDSEIFPYILAFKELEVLLDEEEKKIFFDNMNIIDRELQSSMSGLGIIVLGGEIQIDESGISLKRYHNSSYEKLVTVCCEYDMIQVLRDIICIFNKYCVNRCGNIRKLVFSVSSCLNLDVYWKAYYSLCAYVRYWDSKTGKWCRFPLNRVRRMSIKEAGDILQGMIYKIYKLDHTIVHISTSYKKIVVTFKNEKNELSIKNLFIKMQNMGEKEEFLRFLEILNKIFGLLVQEGRVMEFLTENNNTSPIIKLLRKLRDIFLGRFFNTRNIRILFSKEE